MHVPAWPNNMVRYTYNFALMRCTIKVSNIQKKKALL